MRIPGIILIAFMLASPAFAAPENAAPGTLFFTPDEIMAIKGLETATIEPGLPTTLRLNALLFYGPKNWVFWIGDMRFTPDAGHAGFRVLNVGPDSVSLEIEGTDQKPPRDVSALRPHQAFDTATGALIEDAP